MLLDGRRCFVLCSQFFWLCFLPFVHINEFQILIFSSMNFICSCSVCRNAMIKNAYSRMLKLVESRESEIGEGQGFEGNCSRVWSCYSISLCFSLIIHMLCSAKDEYNGCFWMSIFWSLMWLVGVSKLYPFLSSFCCFLFGPTLTCTAIKLASYHWHASLLLLTNLELAYRWGRNSHILCLVILTWPLVQSQWNFSVCIDCWICWMP